MPSFDLPISTLILGSSQLLVEAIVALLRERDTEFSPRGATFLSDVMDTRNEQHFDMAVVIDAARDAGIGETVTALSSRHPNIAIIAVLLQDDRERLLEALRSGVRGVLDDTFSAEDFAQALKAVAQGQFILTRHLVIALAETLSHYEPDPQRGNPLTAREETVLSLLAKAKTNREIAHSLGIAENTIRSHVRSIMQKLQVSSRDQALAWWDTWLRRSDIEVPEHLRRTTSVEAVPEHLS